QCVDDLGSDSRALERLLRVTACERADSLLEIVARDHAAPLVDGSLQCSLRRHHDIDVAPDTQLTDLPRDDTHLSGAHLLQPVVRAYTATACKRTLRFAHQRLVLREQRACGARSR